MYFFDLSKSYVTILAKLTSSDLMNFLWKKKLQNRKNCILTKNTFYPISPVLINLQTCTIPNFKGNFIINDSFYIMDESQWLPALLQKKLSVYFFSWHPLFWLFLADFGCSWLFLVIFGCFWLLRVVLGCFWLLLPNKT